jgi:cysteine-rich repeat protein
MNGRAAPWYFRRMGLRRSLAVLAALLTTSPASAWKVDVANRGAAHAVATTADGDVIAAGLFDAGAGNRIIVVRLAASGHSERWRTEILGRVEPARRVLLTLDAAGDVLLAAGGDPNPSSFGEAIKLAGDTGAIRWARDLSGLSVAIHTDDANDVYVASQQLAVAKLSGATGDPAWTFEETGTAADLAMLGGQDPVVVGSLPPALPPVTPTGVAIRIDRMTGVPAWTSTLAPEHGVPAHVAAAGEDVFVGGGGTFVFPNMTSAPGVALALDASTGAVRWGRGIPSFSVVDGVAVTATGDVAVAGVDLVRNTLFPTGTTLRALVLARADGAIRAQGPVAPHVIVPSCPACGSGGRVTGLVAHPSGDLSIVGSFGQSDLIVARLAAADLHLVWRRDGGSFPAVPGHFLPSAAAAGAGGTLAVAGLGDVVVGAVPKFTVLSFDAAGALRLCGDDTVDPGEACDDGNLDASDCCAADCSDAEPDGTECADDSLCTIDDRCAGGRCEGGGPLPCEPCGECHSAIGCFVDAPSSNCGQSTITDGSQITIARPRRGSDRFTWSLRSGPATAKSAFGNPLETSGYALCASLPGGKLVLRGVAPAGGCGRRRSCWRSTRAGFEYVNPSAPDGLARLSLRAGGAGRARWSAGGAHAILLEPLPLAQELYVELRRLDDPATCWSATLPKVTKNSSRKYRAKGQ